jgi:hypothetical protein
MEREKMKIGFIGSHGTGKTSTAEVLSEMTSIPFLGSTARTASALRLPVNQEASPMSQMLVTVSRANQVLGNWGQDIITDRTPLDSHAYTTYQADYVWAAIDAMPWYLEQSRTLVANAMLHYNFLFYFPILWELSADDVRKDDLLYQRAIDDRLIVLMREMQLPVITMPEGTSVERAHFIQAHTVPVMV